MEYINTVNSPEAVPIISFTNDKNTGSLKFTLNGVITSFKVTKETKKSGIQGAIQSFFNFISSRTTAHLIINKNIYSIKKETLNPIKEEYSKLVTLDLIKNSDSEKNELINVTITKILRIAEKIKENEENNAQIGPPDNQGFCDIPL